MLDRFYDHLEWNSAIEIRDATPGDAEAIRAVHRESIPELGTQAYSREQIEAWAQGCASADYTSAIERGDLEYVVAEREDEIVGFGSLNLSAPEGYAAEADVEVTGSYVDPSVAREGVGSRLSTELEERARSRGVQMLGLAASRKRFRSTRRRGTTGLGSSRTNSRVTSRRG